jgi:hypothetical protein
MIRCEECKEWYHGKCVKVTQEEAEAMTVFGEKKGRPGMPIGHRILTCLAQSGYRPPCVRWII